MRETEKRENPATATRQLYTGNEEKASEKSPLMTKEQPIFSLPVDPRAALHDRIERVKAANRIEEVIAREAGVSLKRIGANLVCRCPFPDHEDSKPSFTVYLNKQSYYCYGCRRGGDVICFVMDYCKLSFKESLTRLDDGIACQEVAAKAVGNESLMAASTPVSLVRQKQLMRQCRDFFHQCLGESEAGQALLKQRGLWSPELVSHFKIGFDNGKINQAINGDIQEELRTIGLVNDKGNSRFYQCLTVGLEDGEGEVVSLQNHREGQKIFVPTTRRSP